MSKRNRVLPISKQKVTDQEYAYWDDLLCYEGLETLDFKTGTDGNYLMYTEASNHLGSKDKYVKMSDHTSFYAIIGVYAHNAEFRPIVEKYRNVMIDYAMSGILNETCAKYGYPESSVRKFIDENFKKMLHFYNEFENEE